MRMKKLLMFLVLLTVSVGTWAAATVTVTGNTCTVEFTSNGDIMNYNFTNEQLNCEVVIFKYTGTGPTYMLQDGDFAKISTFKSKVIDLSSAVLTYGNVNALSNSTVEYLLLPCMGVDSEIANESSDLWTTRCPNLKGAMNSVATNVWNVQDISTLNGEKAYVRVKNEGDFAILSQYAAAHSNETYNLTPTFIVSGPLGESDIEDLSAMDQVKNLRLENAQISTDDISNLEMDNMEYLRLPSNFDSPTLMSGLDDKNPNLKVAASTNVTGSSASTIVIQSYEKNNISNLSIKLALNDEIGNVTNVNMSGLLGDKDLYNNGKNFAAAKSFDFTGATFSSITLASVSGSTTLEDNPSYTDYETNSLYYISNYASVIESVVLPTGNTEVPINAFAGASNLTEIDIPSNYTKIGACAFYNSGVVWAEISKNMETVEPYAFLSSQLTDLVFEKGLTHLNFGTGAFSGISTLKHVVLPEGVLSLGNALFRRCTALESVRLPSTLTYIGEYCFSQTALSQITIPKGVERIDAGAFANCTNLTDVYVTNTERAPAIICAPQNPELQSTTRPSTFGRAQLINNTGSGYQGSFTGQENVSETWEAGLEKYRGNDGEKLIALHYPTTAAALYDEPDIVAQYNIVTSDNLTLPTRNHNDYSLKYGTCYTSWSDGHEHSGTFNQTNTFEPYYETAGALEADSLEGYWTRRGWKQFAITKAYVPGESEVIPITLKDVWYTMCYPFNLSDELLEETYGAHYDICEFSSVEISNEYSNNGTYSIVLHFNEVATDESEYDDPTSETSKQKDAGDTENSTHFLAKAFHPYMIHPNTGTHVDEDKVETYFTGIKYLDDPAKCNEYERIYYYGSASGTTLQQGAWTKKVNIPVTLVSNADETEVISGEVTDAQIESESYKKFEGNFTFVGNVYRNGNVQTDYPTENDIWANSANFSKIPFNAYFLGQASPTSWPKYYRESSNNLSRPEGNWTLYTSIILTDRVIEDELAKINGNILEAAGNQGTKTINAFELSFDEYDQPYVNGTTDIKEVIEEAKEKNLPVQFIDIVYDFNGKIVKKGDNSLENLPTGLYIVNGKKYMVK